MFSRRKIFYVQHLSLVCWHTAVNKRLKRLMGILLVIKVLGPKAFYSNSSGGLLLLVSGRKIITRPLIKKGSD